MYIHVSKYIYMYVSMYETKFCPQHNSWTDKHNERNFRMHLRLVELIKFWSQMDDFKLVQS